MRKLMWVSLLVLAACKQGGGTAGANVPVETEDQKTLYAVANDRRVVEVYAIAVIAEGNPRRAK